MEYDMIKDVSTITSIPDKTLKKLVTKIVYCINDAVAEANAAGEDLVDLDIGLGTLAIKLDSDTIKYKFIPSAELEKSIRETILNERNLLEDALDAALVDRLTNTYKDLI